jgi:hypothetical protein
LILRARCRILRSSRLLLSRLRGVYDAKLTQVDWCIVIAVWLAFRTKQATTLVARRNVRLVVIAEKTFATTYAHHPLLNLCPANRVEDFGVRALGGVVPFVKPRCSNHRFQFLPCPKSLVPINSPDCRK